MKIGDKYKSNFNGIIYKVKSKIWDGDRFEFAFIIVHTELDGADYGSIVYESKKKKFTDLHELILNKVGVHKVSGVYKYRHDNQMCELESFDGDENEDIAHFTNSESCKIRNIDKEFIRWD
tara:strand:- start:1256 stop:1618 length:363 start_codon:yes stop_codon:yes gene_type:complete